MKVSTEFWYVFQPLYTDGNVILDERMIRSYLKDYYEGFVGQNIIVRKIPADKLVNTKVLVKKAPAAEGDIQTWKGTVSILNYMAKRPTVLNFVVHHKKGGRGNRTILFTEVSPRPAEHSIWKSLDHLNSSLRPGI